MTLLRGHCSEPDGAVPGRGRPGGRPAAAELLLNVLVVGSYVYFSWYFFQRKIQVATPGLSAGFPGAEAGPDAAGGGVKGQEDPLGGGEAWSSSPGMGFFLGCLGSGTIPPSGGGDKTLGGSGGAGGRSHRSVVLMGVWPGRC